MSDVRQVWLNDRLVDERAASVSVYDRGFLFGDGVYELVRFFRCDVGPTAASGRRRHGVAMELHVARLRRSLQLARIEGFDAHQLDHVCHAVLDANGLDDAAVYVQITRGAGPSRSHVPQGPLTPTVFASATVCEPIERFCQPATVAAITLEDVRWKLCQIKTISLMGNILALLEADAHGATEAILYRTQDGRAIVGEGAYTNVFAVIDGTLVTPPLDDDPPILHGVTRADAVTFAPRAGIATVVRPITLDELRTADEVIISSSRRLVSAVTTLDGATVGAGRAGPIAIALFHAMRQHIVEQCGSPRTSPPFPTVA